MEIESIINDNDDRPTAFKENPIQGILDGSLHHEETQ
ncbi:hypothetical protein GWI33_008723, partial [Rhynchophorus ferrugineus]